VKDATFSVIKFHYVFHKYCQRTKRTTIQDHLRKRSVSTLVFSGVFTTFSADKELHFHTTTRQEQQLMSFWEIKNKTRHEDTFISPSCPRESVTDTWMLGRCVTNSQDSLVYSSVCPSRLPMLEVFDNRADIRYH